MSPLNNSLKNIFNFLTDLITLNGQCRRQYIKEPLSRLSRLANFQIKRAILPTDPELALLVK